MDDIQINKEKLLAQLRTNLGKHHETYERAVEEYHRQQVKLLERLLEDAKHGKPVDHFALSRMPVPEDHTSDYEVAIEMLELEERDTVLLDHNSYMRYYRDEWEWRRAWHANTVSYVQS